jgi:hypothetical protein
MLPNKNDLQRGWAPLEADFRRRVTRRNVKKHSPHLTPLRNLYEKIIEYTLQPTRAKHHCLDSQYGHVFSVKEIFGTRFESGAMQISKKMLGF